MKRNWIYISVIFLAFACNPDTKEGERSVNTIDYQSTNPESEMNKPEEDTLSNYPVPSENIERRKNEKELNADRDSKDPDTLYSNPGDVRK